MGGRLFTDKLVFGGWKVLVFGRLTVPPWLPLLTPPTLVDCQVKELDEGRLEVAVDE